MRWRTLAVAMLCALGTQTVRAADVTFDANLSNTCTIALGTDGHLALSSDGSRMGTEEAGGSAGTVTILSLGSNTIDVSAPALAASPGGYDSTGQQLEGAYQGLGGLSLVSQGYTTSATSFDVGSIALSVLDLNARLTNDNGFATGAYQLKTTVTCR